MPSTTTTAPSLPLPSQGKGAGGLGLPLRQRAFTLYCQGHRSPAIAARLSVPERTIRSWIEADLRQLAAEQRAQTRQELLQLAIARQLAIATAAWDAYSHLTAPSADEPAEVGFPDSPAETATSPTSPSRSLSCSCAACRACLRTSPIPSKEERPGEGSPSPSAFSASSVVPSAAPGARYLRIAQAAYREIDRLQGLYLPAPAEPQEVRIILERIPNDEADAAPTTQPAPHLQADSSLHRGGERLGEGSPASPAATATSPHSSASSAVSSAESPAETATPLAPQHRTPSSSPPTGERPGEGSLWPGYGPGEPLPRHIAGMLGLPHFRERNRRPQDRRPARPLPPPLFAYRL